MEREFLSAADIDNWTHRSADQHAYCAEEAQLHVSLARDLIAALYEGIIVDARVSLWDPKAPSGIPQAALNVISQLLRRGLYVLLMIPCDRMHLSDYARRFETAFGSLGAPCARLALTSYDGQTLEWLKVQAREPARNIVGASSSPLLGDEPAVQALHQKSAFTDAWSVSGHSYGYTGPLDELVVLSLRQRFGDLASLVPGHLLVLAEVVSESTSRHGAQSGYFSLGPDASSSPGAVAVCRRDGTFASGADALGVLAHRLRLCPPLSLPDGKSHMTLWRDVTEFQRRNEGRSSSLLRRFESHAAQRVAALACEQLADLSPGSDRHVFDPVTGGVLLTEWELADLVDTQPWARVFDLNSLFRSDANSLGSRRAMLLDSGAVLRGPDYYMFVTGRSGGEHLGMFLESSLIFQREALAALQHVQPTRLGVPQIKAILGVLDNVRDCLLQWLNIAQRPPQTAMPSADPSVHSTLGALAVAVTEVLVDAFLLGSRCTGLDLIARTRSTLAEIERWLDGPARALVEHIMLGEDVRPVIGTVFRWREADNLVENAAAVWDTLQHVHTPSLAPLVTVGLSYGGLELGILGSVMASRMGVDSTPATMHVSLYKNAAVGMMYRSQRGDFVLSGGIDTAPITILCGGWGSPHLPTQGSTVVLFDDNCTSGKTLELARDRVVLAGGDVVACGVVRFTGAGRALQMSWPSHGCFDPEMAGFFTHGLVRQSPYSRLSVEHPRFRYRDEGGVFDLTRTHVMSLLHKNSPLEFKNPQLEPWGM